MASYTTYTPWEFPELSVPDMFQDRPVGFLEAARSWTNLFGEQEDLSYKRRREEAAEAMKERFRQSHGKSPDEILDDVQSVFGETGDIENFMQLEQIKAQRAQRKAMEFQNTVETFVNMKKHGMGAAADNYWKGLGLGDVPTYQNPAQIRSFTGYTAGVDPQTGYQYWSRPNTPRPGSGKPPVGEIMVHDGLKLKRYFPKDTVTRNQMLAEGWREPTWQEVDSGLRDFSGVMPGPKTPDQSARQATEDAGVSKEQLERDRRGAANAARIEELKQMLDERKKR